MKTHRIISNSNNNDNNKKQEGKAVSYPLSEHDDKTNEDNGNENKREIQLEVNDGLPSDDGSRIHTRTDTGNNSRVVRRRDKVKLTTEKRSSGDLGKDDDAQQHPSEHREYTPRAANIK